VATIVVVLGSLLWMACGTKKPSEQDVTASLPDLPQTDVAKLKPVPRAQMLATSEVLWAAPAPPESQSAVHQNCAQDSSETDYSVEVKYPITVCLLPPNVPSVPIGTSTGSFAPTHKLDSSNLSAEQKAVAGEAQTLKVWWCHQDNGPWQGSLISTRECTVSCSTLNTLTLTNTPNMVGGFHWYGSPFTIPDGAPFSYASKPVALGPPIDNGACNGR
jgi:hypothetical protein